MFCEIFSLSLCDLFSVLSILLFHLFRFMQFTTRHRHCQSILCLYVSLIVKSLARQDHIFSRPRLCKQSEKIFLLSLSILFTFPMNLIFGMISFHEHIICFKPYLSFSHGSTTTFVMGQVVWSRPFFLCFMFLYDGVLF